jgi:hypothetical protein
LTEFRCAFKTHSRNWNTGFEFFLNLAPSKTRNNIAESPNIENSCLHLSKFPNVRNFIQNCFCVTRKVMAKEWIPTINWDWFMEEGLEILKSHHISDCFLGSQIGLQILLKFKRYPIEFPDDSHSNSTWCVSLCSHIIMFSITTRLQRNDVRRHSFSSDWTERFAFLRVRRRIWEIEHSVTIVHRRSVRLNLLKVHYFRLSTRCKSHWKNRTHVQDWWSFNCFTAISRVLKGRNDGISG